MQRCHASNRYWKLNLIRLQTCWWNQAETRRIWASPHLVYSTVQYLTTPLSNRFYFTCQSSYTNWVVSRLQLPDDDDDDDRMMVITARCRCVTLNMDSSERVFTARHFASAAYAVMRCLQCPCVDLRVCLSRSYILSKRINISPKFFHHRIATPF